MTMVVLSQLDREIIMHSQAGLPLVSQPYHALAEQLQVPVEEVLARMRHLQETGAIRRIAAVPNHYRLGYTANAMTVWDIDDARITETGQQLASHARVSHCYERPRIPVLWRYNLFAMVHGTSREEVKKQVTSLAKMIEGAWADYEIIWSRRILKKTGMRLRQADARRTPHKE